MVQTDQKTNGTVLQKVRITEKPPRNSIDFPIYELMEDNKILRHLLSSASGMCKPSIIGDIKHNEKKIAVMQGNKCMGIISAANKDLTPNGTFNQNAAWKLKKKLFPKCSDAPFAVYDSEEQLVTNSEGILKVMKEEFTHTLCVLIQHIGMDLSRIRLKKGNVMERRWR